VGGPGEGPPNNFAAEPTRRVDGAFTYDGGIVAPGETRRLRYTVSETYLGDPVRIPVVTVNGDRPVPTVFLSAAAHGDELNGIAVVREVAHEWNTRTSAGRSSASRC